jgi:hypothetical protein
VDAARAEISALQTALDAERRRSAQLADDLQARLTEKPWYRRNE